MQCLTLLNDCGLGGLGVTDFDYSVAPEEITAPPSVPSPNVTSVATRLARNASAVLSAGAAAEDSTLSIVDELKAG